MTYGNKSKTITSIGPLTVSTPPRANWSQIDNILMSQNFGCHVADLTGCTFFYDRQRVVYHVQVRRDDKMIDLEFIEGQNIRVIVRQAWKDLDEFVKRREGG